MFFITRPRNVDYSPSERIKLSLISPISPRRVVRENVSYEDLKKGDLVVVATPECVFPAKVVNFNNSVVPNQIILRCHSFRKMKVHMLSDQDDSLCLTLTVFGYNDCSYLSNHVEFWKAEDIDDQLKLLKEFKKAFKVSLRYSYSRYYGGVQVEADRLKLVSYGNGYIIKRKPIV